MDKELLRSLPPSVPARQPPTKEAPRIRCAVDAEESSPTYLRSADLDGILHAAQGRLTGGLSLIAQALAILDWRIHFANAPFGQVELAAKALDQWARLGRVIQGEKVIAPPPSDHRFLDPAWQQPPFNLISQAFLLWEEWWTDVAQSAPGVSWANQRIVSFRMRQLVDILSPSNVPWLNPEVIQATVATHGGNFVAGAENLRADLYEALSGRASGRDAAFRVGPELAATPGKVIFRNELIELIQYAPATPAVGREPVLIVPAWIMKYYILDLSPHNSLIRYLVEHGHTVFTISWRNPGAELRDTGLDDYRTKGVMAALEVVRDVCPNARVHATGYCLGGTLLSITAAAMARDGDDRLASVTLFCAQTDFTEAGELQLFITEDQLALLDDVMRAQGYLDSRQMAGTFEILRSNDLIWSRLIKTYLLGKREHPNDLMAWNADGTRLPARMHSEYLRRMFLNDELAEGRFPVEGRPVAISDIRVPLFVVGTEMDHIAPWHSVYKIHLLNDADLTFVLTSGGHNAGIVSEPGLANRHFHIGHRVPGALYIGSEDWLTKAQYREGSWWPAWLSWLQAQSTEYCAPPSMGSVRYPAITDAPGQYVHEH